MENYNYAKVWWPGRVPRFALIGFAAMSSSTCIRAFLVIFTAFFVIVRASFVVYRARTDLIVHIEHINRGLLDLSDDLVEKIRGKSQWTAAG